MVEVEALASGCCTRPTQDLNFYGEPVKCVFKSVDKKAVRGIDIKDILTVFDDGSIISKVLGKVYLDQVIFQEDERKT